MITARTFAGAAAISGLVVVSLVFHGLSGRPAPPRPNDDTLPLVVATRMQPIADGNNFKDDYGYFRYPAEPDPQPPKEEPFATDEAAIAAAQQWIVAHFGTLPPHTSLKVKSLEHSSSGHPRAAFDWDHGHTITFTQLFRGIPTDRFAVIYITGRTQFSASVSLCSFEPLPRSRKPVVNQNVAIKALRDVYEKMNVGPKFLAEFDKTAHAKMSYVWSPEANRDHLLDDVDVLAPTWVINAEERLVVDAHTGKPWMND
jgi:hypothetical protein